MSKMEAKALLRKYCDELLCQCISLSFEYLPLPNPPLEIPDFPAQSPENLNLLTQQALGISSFDTAGFLYRLELVIERHQPDYVKRHINPKDETEKWLLKNINQVSERILILQIKDWLGSALDDESPDTDRWYLSVSILIGLALKGSSITESEAFNLFQSIIFARKPGEAHSVRYTGNHHIAWDGKENSSHHQEIGHPSGVLAANCILDILQLHQTHSDTVLPNWLEKLSISKQISSLLNIPLRLQNLIIDCNESNYRYLVMASIHILSGSPDLSKEILFQISSSEKVFLRRELASNLPRIDSEDRDFCISLLEQLIEDVDSDTRVLSTTYLGNLARFERAVFIQFAKKISNMEDHRMLQRIVESGLRHYLSTDSNDPDDLIPSLWIRCNQESRSQLSGMIIEIAKINKESFLRISNKIHELDKTSHRDLVSSITLRNGEFGDMIRNNQ
tara:strand:+ start:21620 stop:22966 length:1347 start_codon:yes stop_codon:yes gene_type:complete